MAGEVEIKTAWYNLMNAVVASVIYDLAQAYEDQNDFQIEYLESWCRSEDAAFYTDTHPDALIRYAKKLHELNGKRRIPIKFPY